jgi:hypothetical protein
MNTHGMLRSPGSAGQNGCGTDMQGEGTLMENCAKAQAYMNFLQCRPSLHILRKPYPMHNVN